MILTLKSRIAGIVLLLFFANTAFSQWSTGAFVSIAPQAGYAFNKQVRNYSWAAGGVGKLSIPIGTSDYFTVSVNALSINGKSKEGKNLKEHDILSGFVGYRYDFRREDAYSYFYMEPQIGWTASGTDYNTFSVLPLVGYSLNEKIDFGLWYHASTTTKRLSKIGVGGIMIAYNFHLSPRSE